MHTLYQKSFLKLSSFNYKEINDLIEFSIFLKKNRKKEPKYLKNKKIALIFEKSSTRTRCAFEIAAYEQGAYTTYIGNNNTHIGKKESIQDTAKILSYMYDGIQYRGESQKTLISIDQNSSIPVWNGLTTEFHPTQILADLMTIREIYPNKLFNEITCAYVGDAQNNIANTIIEAAYITGLKVNIVSPKKYWPKKEFLKKNFLYFNENKQIKFTENIADGVKHVNFIYTDVWVSMNESEKLWEEKIKNLRSYQVNQDMLNISNNSDIKVLHCLPALHNKDSELGYKIHKKYNFSSGIEITNDIFNSQYNLSFKQSENKIHTIKALLISTLIKNL